jgi:hypothetical protein
MFPPPWLVGVDRLRCKWLNLKSATKMFYPETVMPTAEQRNAYAAEYQLLGQQVGVSIRRAATLMAISQSWTILADNSSGWRRSRKTKANSAVSFFAAVRMVRLSVPRRGACPLFEDRSEAVDLRALPRGRAGSSFLPPRPPR